VGRGKNWSEGEKGPLCLSIRGQATGEGLPKGRNTSDEDNYDSGQFEWTPGAQPNKKACRRGERRKVDRQTRGKGGALTFDARVGGRSLP